jgi:CMP-N-acetylneuraminic acid synthetase
LKYQVVIPARGGSKRFPGKNIATFLGLPLLVHSIRYAFENGFEAVYVNTDDAHIAAVAEEYQATIVKRPPSLGLDTTSTVEVMQQQIHWFQKNEIACDALILLQPTNPIRPDDLLTQAIKHFEIEKRGSLATYSRLNKKFGRIRANEFIPQNYQPGQRMQDIEPSYFENGLIYITHVNEVLKGHVITPDVFPLVVDHFSSHIDIDEPMDLHLGEALIERMKKAEP